VRSSWLNVPQPTFPSQRAPERYPDSLIVVVYPLAVTPISKVTFPACHPDQVGSGIKKPRTLKSRPAEYAPYIDAKRNVPMKTRRKNLRFMKNRYALSADYKEKCGKYREKTLFEMKKYIIV
jgi:hypothetical protein